MNVKQLIEELSKHDSDAEVITPGNHFGHAAWGITEVVEVEPVRLTDGSEYPVVMLRSE